MPKVFPGFQQLCHTSPSKYPHSSQPQSSPWSLKPEHEHPAQASKPLLCWEVFLRSDICSEFSPFCLLYTCCCTTLSGSEALLDPILKGVSNSAETFLLSRLPPSGADNILKLFLFFYLYLSPYLIPRRSSCLSGRLGVLPVFRCSAGVFPYTVEFLMYLCAVKVWFSHLIPLPSWKSRWGIMLPYFKLGLLSLQ